MNETYKDSLNGLVEHSLIHLYLHCAESSRFIPIPKRNQILVRHLKPKIKDAQYSGLKNELKRFVAIGRKAKGDLEQRLIEFQKINVDLEENNSDVKKLFSLVETLKIKLKMDSRFIQKNENHTSSICLNLMLKMALIAKVNRECLFQCSLSLKILLL